MQRKQRDAEQCQRMKHLVLHARLKHRKIGSAQLTLEGMGSESAKRNAGQAEQRGKDDISTNHCHFRSMALAAAIMPALFAHDRAMLRNLLLRLSKLLLWLIGLSALLVLLFRWVPPPFTALMIERKIESWRTGETIDLTRDWRPWKVLPDDLKMAVIAAEDQKFADHWGFDVAAIRAALSHNERGGSLRGASTLSQQVAKNLFLWSGRSWPRKGLRPGSLR